MLSFAKALLYSFNRADFLLRSGGKISQRTGSHVVGVDVTVPLIMRIVLFSCTSILCTCVLFNQEVQQYSAHEKTRASDVV